MKRIVRIFAVLIVLTIFAASFSGCGSAQEKTAGTQAQDNAKEASGKAVKISVYGVPNDWREAGNALEQAFMDKYPNIRIEDIPYVADSLTFIKTRAAANDLPDITEINNDDTGIRLASEGKMMDLKDLECVQHIFKKVRDDYTLPNGLVFGLTQGFSTSFIFYNQDIFKEVGIDTLPTCFDEFTALCQKLSDKGITPMALPAQDPVSSGFPFDYLAANLLGEKLGLGNYEKALREGTLDLTTPEGVEALKRIQTLAKYFQKGVTSATESNAHDLFAQKKVAMVFAGSWTSGLAEQAGNVGVMFPPFNDKGKELWIETSSESGIGASNTHSDAAVVDAKKKFLEFWFSPEGYKIEQNARGNVPSIDNAMDVKLLSGIRDLLPTLSSSKSFTMNYAVYSSQAFEVFTSSMQELLISSTTPEKVAEKLTEAIKKYPKKVN